MANHLNNPLGMGQLTIADGGLAGITTPNYGPFSQAIYAPSLSHYPRSIEHAGALVGTFHIVKIENGVLVEWTLGSETKRYYCEGFKEAGEKITALCVEKELKAT